ncbi:MAG: protein-tyrosine kinase [Lachnospiraceae bacterium]|nr:protein-tyrosine kinase [Lachnospiraceae bacterium]
MDDKLILEKDDTTEIDLAELIFELWINKWQILMAMIFTGILAYFVSSCLMTPKYTSVTSLYVLAQQDNEALTTADLSVGTQLTNDYAVLVKSRPVLDQVITDLDLTMSPDQLEKLISVENKSNTRIIKISVTYEDPLQARLIADRLRVAVGEQIVSVMNIDAVNTVEEASLPKKPSSPRVLRNTLIGIIAGMVLAAAFFVIRSVMDDTVKTSEDVEKALGLPLLGSIPDSKSNDIAKSKK